MSATRIVDIRSSWFGDSKVHSRRCFVEDEVIWVWDSISETFTSNFKHKPGSGEYKRLMNRIIKTSKKEQARHE